MTTPPYLPPAIFFEACNANPSDRMSSGAPRTLHHGWSCEPGIQWRLVSSKLYTHINNGT